MPRRPARPAICNSADGADAFGAYSRVKLEGVELATREAAAEEGADPHRVYKIHKAKVVRSVLEQARAWRRAGERTEDRDAGNEASVASDADAPTKKRDSIRGMRKSIARATNMHHFFSPAPPPSAA